MRDDACARVAGVWCQNMASWASTVDIPWVPHEKAAEREIRGRSQEGWLKDNSNNSNSGGSSGGEL